MSIKTHNNKKPKAVGLVDGDDPGNDIVKTWNKIDSHIKSCKCFKLESPKKLHSAFEKGFTIPITLEVLYPKEVWDWSLKRGYLKKRELSDIIPGSLMNEILEGNQQLHDILDDSWELYVRYDYKNEKKIAVATYLSKKENIEFKKSMGDFEGITNKIVSYLFKDERESVGHKTQEISPNISKFSDSQYQTAGQIG